MDDLYWIWLSIALGAGARIKRAVDFFGTPEEMYKASYVELYLCPFLTPSQVEKLDKSLLDEAKKIVEICEKNNWPVITPANEMYPKRLTELPDLPLTLYTRGKMINFDEITCISIVGTRKASGKGLNEAYNIAFELAKNGAVVVSGGALGIDTATHKGALSANGLTAAVLGNGFGYSYLPQNKMLREIIAKTGVLITENPPFQKPTKYSFPIRNRIISAISRGTLVIEAGNGSGSLLTARHALRQKRDVFAVHHDDGFSALKCTELANMVSDGNAHSISSAKDILEFYGIEYKAGNEIKQHRGQSIQFDMGPSKQNGHDTKVNKNPKAESKRSPEHDVLSSESLEIFNLLKDRQLSADEIIQETGMEIRNVMSALMELQLKKYIREDFGNKYAVI